MDDLVLMGNDIHDFVSAKLENLQDSFSILNVGHITKFVEPLNRSLRLSDALRAFVAFGDATSLPVDGDFGVIGIVQKKDLLKKKSALVTMTDPSVERFIDKSSFSIDASENCEKVMALILKRDLDKLYDDFMIYHGGKFFGIGTFAELSRNIARIRGIDLERAKIMQDFLMAKNSIERPGIVAERYVRMAHEIGGDYLQCMDISDRLSMLSCFDVCGKGAAAALLTTTLSAFFSTMKTCGTLSSFSPPAILKALNSVVIDQTPDEIFIAGILVFVDREKREVTLYNCGYSPLYIFYTDDTDGKTKGKIVNADLMPLGINEFSDPRGRSFPILRNFRVFMHSDGLTDACNEKGERYGEERLRKFLYPRCMKKPGHLVRDLDAEIRAFAGSAPLVDDITVLAAEIF